MTAEDDKFSDLTWVESKIKDGSQIPMRKTGIIDVNSLNDDYKDIFLAKLHGCNFMEYRESIEIYKTIRGVRIVKGVAEYGMYFIVTFAVEKDSNEKSDGILFVGCEDNIESLEWIDYQCTNMQDSCKLPLFIVIMHGFIVDCFIDRYCRQMKIHALNNKSEFGIFYRQDLNKIKEIIQGYYPTSRGDDLLRRINPMFSIKFNAMNTNWSKFEPQIRQIHDHLMKHIKAAEQQEQKKDDSYVCAIL